MEGSGLPELQQGRYLIQQSTVEVHAETRVNSISSTDVQDPIGIRQNLGVSSPPARLITLGHKNVIYLLLQLT